MNQFETEFVPDWGHKCVKCGAAPVVALHNPDGMNMRTGFCGPCFFNNPDATEPAKWSVELVPDPRKSW